jgi:hypothetical protein
MPATRETFRSVVTADQVNPCAGRARGTTMAPEYDHKISDVVGHAAGAGDLRRGAADGAGDRGRGHITAC